MRAVARANTPARPKEQVNSGSQAARGKFFNRLPSALAQA